MMITRCPYLFLYGKIYGWLMRLTHRFNWHYAPPLYPDGDTMLWCQWCGFRAVIKKRKENS